jgi:hypothetical protein
MTVTESTGEDTEVVQRRQDFDIQALKEQVNTNFLSTTVTHTFALHQLDQWRGYNGEALPEGILDVARSRL